MHPIFEKVLFGQSFVAVYTKILAYHQRGRQYLFILLDGKIRLCVHLDYMNWIVSLEGEICNEKRQERDKSHWWMDVQCCSDVWDLWCGVHFLPPNCFWILLPKTFSNFLTRYSRKWLETCQKRVLFRYIPHFYHTDAQIMLASELGSVHVLLKRPQLLNHRVSMRVLDCAGIGERELNRLLQYLISLERCDGISLINTVTKRQTFV